MIVIDSDAVVSGVKSIFLSFAKGSFAGIKIPSIMIKNKKNGTIFPKNQ